MTSKTVDRSIFDAVVRRRRKSAVLRAFSGEDEVLAEVDSFSETEESDLEKVLPDTVSSTSLEGDNEYGDANSADPVEKNVELQAEEVDQVDTADVDQGVPLDIDRLVPRQDELLEEVNRVACIESLPKSKPKRVNAKTQKKSKPSVSRGFGGRNDSQKGAAVASHPPKVRVKRKRASLLDNYFEGL